MSKKLKIIAAAAVAVPLGIGLAASSIVNAEEGDQTIWQRAFDIMGVEEDDAVDAFKQARLERVDDLLQDEIITEDQANQMRERIMNDEDPFGPPMHGRGMRRGFMNPERLELLSEFFGVSTDDLKADFEEGLRPHDLLEKYGKSQEDMHEFMEEHRDEMPHGGRMGRGMGMHQPDQN